MSKELEEYLERGLIELLKSENSNISKVDFKYNPIPKGSKSTFTYVVELISVTDGDQITEINRRYHVKQYVNEETLQDYSGTKPLSSNILLFIHSSLLIPLFFLKE